MKDFFQSKDFKIIITILISLLIILLVFQLGMFVGHGRADFSFRWGENYHRNFGGPEQGFFGKFGGRDFIAPNGAAGQIIKIDDQNITVKGRDAEKIIVLSDQTTIRRFRETIKLTDLKIDDYIVVIGEPNDLGQIEAKLIRVMPPPPTPGDNPRMIKGI